MPSGRRKLTTFRRLTVAGKICLALVLAAVFVPASTFAHGTHATFLSPKEGATYVDTVEVHVEKTPRSFPFIHVIVRTVDGSAIWSAPVALGKDGYFKRISLKDWKQGSYLVEVQFLGDIVEQVQQRSFVVDLP